MEIKKNSRQMPSTRTITREKDYCDLLYAWLQCHSERDSVYSTGRKIDKAEVKWSKIEKDFTKEMLDGSKEKIMTRQTIAKYFNYLVKQGLVVDLDKYYYYLKPLDADEANLIEYNTLSKLMNVLKRNSISIYIYLFNRYYANGCESFVVTLAQIKDFIGISTATTSNNIIIDDTIDILKRLGLLDFRLVYDKEKEKRYIEFLWVRNELP